MVNNNNSNNNNEHGLVTTTITNPMSSVFRVSRLQLLCVGLNRMIGMIYVSSISVLICMIWYIYLTKLFGIVRKRTSSLKSTIHTLLALYFLISVSVNFIFCLLTRPSKKPVGSEDLDVENMANGEQYECVKDPRLTRAEFWRVCHICEGPKPPRTHHCSTCNACYTRMCHHCPALGRCVARDNYPFFFRFVWAACLGSAFAAWTAMWIFREAPSSRNGENSEDDVDYGMIYLVMICGAGITVATGMLAIWHVYLAGTAQTTVEWLENFRVRRRGDAPPHWGRFGGPFTKDLKANIKDSLGEPPWLVMPWWTVLILPLSRDAGERCK